MICLEINYVALLSAKDDVEVIYANDVNPHNILMRIPVPKCAEETNTHCSIMISEFIGSATSRWILRVLFDSGSNRSLIRKQVIPKADLVTTCKNLNPTTTLGGTVQFNQMVMLEQLCFPDFNKDIKIEQHEMIMFDSSCWYDIILGRDFP